MDSLTYNFRFAIVPPIESLLLRCSYLINDRSVVTGSSRQQYFHFKDPKDTFEWKLKHLELISADTNFHGDIKVAIKSIKDFKKIKHPNTAQIVAFQRFKKFVTELYENETDRCLQ